MNDQDIFDNDMSDTDFEKTAEFQQHAVTPIYRSVQGSRAGSVQIEMGNMRPFSDGERAIRTVERMSKVPASLQNYWAENIAESLKKLYIADDTVFQPVCMTPTDEQVKRMCARSKCMELLKKDHPSLLSSPNRGQPLCFVAKAAEGLPIHIQKLLFFFTSVQNSMLDLAHFTAPTIATNVLVPSLYLADSRVIRGLVTTGIGLTPDPMEDRHNPQTGDFISVDDILESRAQHMQEEIKVPIQPLSIHLGFTGVVFRDERGSEKREVFSILMVTPAENIELMGYVMEKFLLRPKMGSQKYEQLMEIYLETSSFFKEIMRYECFCNLDADEIKVGLPEDYRLEPGGKLGSVTVLSQFQIPLKIFNNIKKDYPAADLTSIKIIGIPEMTFQRYEENTSEWCKYLHKSINNEAQRQKNLMAGITRYNSSKDKDACPDLNLGMPGGWPLHVDSDGNVLAFGMPPMPLMHKFDANGARGNFSVFIASIGDADQALPDLTRAIITAFLVHSSDIDTRPEIDHLLKDKRLANPLLVLRTYHGPEADPFSALVLANRQKMWFEALKSDIQVRRSKGSDLQEVIRVTKDYLASVVKNLESMIECQVFRSATVTQMKSIVDLIDFEDICTGSEFSIRKTMSRRSKKISKSRKYDSTFRSWYCFMKIWEEMNRYFSLNAGNLVCAFEVMLSQLMFKFAHTNETWTFFFVTVIVMSGNGHFQCQTPDGPVPCRVKPNTTGMDYLLARLTDLWNTMYEKLMIPPKDRHNLILNCMRFTATVWENLVTAQAAAGRLVAVPPSDANFQAMSLTEIRDSLKSLILYGPPRGEEIGQTCSFNSQEIESTRTRVASRKRKMGNNNIVVVCSNVGSKNNEQKEEGNTLDTVCAVLPPGVPPPRTRRIPTEFNHMDANVNTARHQPLENKDEVRSSIVYTCNFAGLYVGLLNHIGAYSTEVNPVVSAFYDWGCYYIKQFVSSSMDTFVRDNFSRMKEGYKSRAIVFSLWLKTLHALSLGKTTRQEAIQHIWNDIHADALPLVNVPLVFCNLLYRGVHMASLLMSSVICDHLKCPIVSFNNLNLFFEMEKPPVLEDLEQGLREDYLQILEFVRLCFINNRFCPAEDAPLCQLSNISCYISGDASADLVPTNPKTSLLRVLPAKDKDETHDISHKVALRVAAQYGETLFGQCHMGPEVSVYRLALVHMVERFCPDFRGLMSSKMFFTRQHMRALNLERGGSGMVDYMESAHPPFAKQFNFRLRDTLQSQAIGVNIWSLLTVMSLIGSTDLHPDISNCFSNNLVQAILAYSPAAATPGDICPTPRFDHSTTACKLYIPSEDRPKHFLRPNEPSFVLNGTLPIGKAAGRFAPEDMLHNSQLSAIPKQLHCDIMDVPANAFTSPYALRPDVSYTFHIPFPDESKYGTIKVDTPSEKVLVEIMKIECEDEVQMLSFDFLEWEEQIRVLGIVITPLIERSGAAVLIDQKGSGSQQPTKIIGCLVPPPENEGLLLDASDCTYHALLTEDMQVAKLFFLDVLKVYLLPIGEILYLDMKVLQEPIYKAQGEQGKLLYTRLGVPHVRRPETGKLYVTCLHQPKASKGRTSRSATAITLAVNPWDVQQASLYTGEPSNIVKHLR